MNYGNLIYIKTFLKHMTFLDFSENLFIYTENDTESYKLIKNNSL